MNKTRDTLVNAIYYFTYCHCTDTATELMRRYIHRERMKFEPQDLDEEEPLSDEEFQAWVNSKF